MGAQVLRALLDVVISESPRTTRVPIFRLAGRPMVVTFGDGSDDVCLVIPCIDSGKATYNSLALPFEQESIDIAKAIHSLAVALVLLLWRRQGAIAEFLTHTLLPRLLASIEETGLGACRDRVANDLARVYSTTDGPADFGRQAREFKETGARRSLAAVGAVGSPAREAWVAGLMAEVDKEATLGHALLLCDILPQLTFGKIGDATWVNCLRTVAEGSDVWESMKSWGTSPTDSMTLAERRAYAALRFPKMAMQPAAIIVANDARVAAIGAPGYSLLLYDKQSYERERIVALSFVASILCALEAKGKLSPLPSLVREIPATVAMGVGAATEVSVFVARDAAFLAEELEFPAVLEHIRTREHPADAKESEPSSLAGNAALKSLAQGMTKPGMCFVWSECCPSNRKRAVRGAMFASGQLPPSAQAWAGQC
ncbi:hypothetical protein HDU86_004711 [Geranomyces michiganensis]|nr:hypothetical protein HDU86_004711 [Geranomyces michiganensis]